MNRENLLVVTRKRLGEPRRLFQVLAGPTLPAELPGTLGGDQASASRRTRAASAHRASGRLDAYIERTINLWDVAAGALLLENAGGEFYALPAHDGKMRMCADNGKLRKKLKIDELLQ